MGVSLPGLYDARSERSLVSPNVSLTNGHRVGPDLQAALERDVEVTVLQECDALCVAEQAHGAARDVLDFAMVDISEGLGLGVVERGKLLEGHSGLAGELGHVTVELNGRLCGCGNRGCLETVATDTVLLERVSERVGETLTMDELLARAAAGRLDIDAELDQVVAYLGSVWRRPLICSTPPACSCMGDCSMPSRACSIALSKKRSAGRSALRATIVR